MKKETFTFTPLFFVAFLTFSIFLSCNNSTKEATEIAGVEITQNAEFTGRGNQNEVLARLAINVNDSSALSLKNMVLIKKDGTQTDDVKEIKIYATGVVDTLDNRTLDSAIALGKAPLSKNNTKINISGELNPGINYLWITADIAEDASEGNKVGVTLASIGFKNNKKYTQPADSSAGREILLARKIIFAPGDYESKFYRIPAIITADDGTLVTATDKRKFENWDLPHDIDLVVRRSSDNGKTWDEPITIAEGQGFSKGYGDAALIKLNTGKLLCIFAGMNGLWKSTPDSLIRTFVSESKDNGLSWTSPRDITAQLYGAECPDPVRSKWMGSFCASGHAIQTSTGRVMLVAAVRERSEFSLNNYLFYSDDEGATWNVSEKAMDGGDEAKVTELADGSILMSIRNKNKGYRYHTKSTDNGVSWEPAQLWTDLKDPACNGDLIRYSLEKDGADKNRLLHSIPFDEKERKNVSVYVSYDEGQTWPVGKTICAGPSAYSALTILPDGTIGAYVEEGTLGMNMVYMNFSLEWLTNHTDKSNIINKD